MDRGNLSQAGLEDVGKEVNKRPGQQISSCLIPYFVE